MLRSLWLLFVYCAFLFLGLSSPFVLTLGYVWVDAFRPQTVAYIILNQMPVAAIMGSAAVASYFAFDRRSPPPLTTANALTAMMAVWVTITLIWAVAPERAFEKWDWAFKTVLFSAFVPLVIRSRIQIEAFIQVYLFSLAANFVAFGAKIILSGGGYGKNLGLQQGNSGLAEGGLLSTACLMMVPLALYLSKHNRLIPQHKFVPLGYLGLAGLAALTAIGTYQRSALIGLIALGGVLFVSSRNKLLLGSIMFVALLGLLYLTSSAWTERISTIEEYSTESSALTRILVWKWTLGFAQSHPLGGGFQSFFVNHIEFPPSPAHPAGYSQFGRAFHSIYFEMLGEQGWPGIAMFGVITLSTLRSLRRIRKQTRDIPDLLWCRDLAGALQGGLAVFLTSGAFVGIAFQPMYWYFVSISVCLQAYLWRIQRPSLLADPGWRRATEAPSPVRQFSAGTSQAGNKPSAR